MKGQDHCELSGCPVACILDVIGDRWTLLIVRELMFNGRHEYGEFLAMEEKISTNILADRLKKLQEQGIVYSCSHPSRKSRKLYYLSKAGKDLIHVLVPMILWSMDHLNDVISVPSAEKKFLKDPQRFIEMMLHQLDLWEKENVPR